MPHRSADLTDSRSTAADVVILSADERLASLVGQIVAACGVRPVLAADAAALDRIATWPTVAVCGQDIDGRIVQAISQTWPDCLVLKAGFGVADHGAVHQLPRDIEKLGLRIERALMPPQAGLRVGVVGLQGGVGATSLAAALARAIAALAGASLLVDLDPGGGPTSAVLGLPGPTTARMGQLLALADDDAGRAQAAELLGDLPVWHGVNLLLGSSDMIGHPAHRVRRVLEAAEASFRGGITVIDASSLAPVTLKRLAAWCDWTILVSRGDQAGWAAIEAAAHRVATAWGQVTMVARTASGRSGPDLPSGPWGADVVSLGTERHLAQAAAHGLGPGDWPRGTLGRCAAGLALRASTMLGAAEVSSATGAPYARRLTAPASSAGQVRLGRVTDRATGRVAGRAAERAAGRTGDRTFGQVVERAAGSAAGRAVFGAGKPTGLSVPMSADLAVPRFGGAGIAEAAASSTTVSVPKPPSPSRAASPPKLLSPTKAASPRPAARFARAGARRPILAARRVGTDDRPPPDLTVSAWEDEW